MAILVKVPPQILEDLVGAAISKQGNIYRGELAKLIGASKESLDGKTSLYLISLMKLCGFAEADMAKVLKKFGMMRICLTSRISRKMRAVCSSAGFSGIVRKVAT